MTRKLSLKARVRKAAAAIVLAQVVFGTGAVANAADRNDTPTATPIKHVVVIFQENVSFDHYFATYPFATNPTGEPEFHARPGTPSVNGLDTTLLHFNLNSTQPFRLDRSQAATCDQDHEYTDEQAAYDHGLADKFVETVGNGPGTDGTLTCHKSDVMGYYDGNTATALWNYAQFFAMSDNSFNTTFGPSTPGALNLISGQTHGVSSTTGDTSSDVVDGTVIGDPQPGIDKCSTRETVTLTGQNVGDLLNLKGVSWGWFQGGFRDCSAFHIGSDGKNKGDYIPHHAPFQYYASTSNKNHVPPTSVDATGHQGDQANHQYDLTDFWAAAAAHNLPAVSFLKAAGYQDGHAGYSDPVAEQQFLVDTINKLQQMPEWHEMAVIISYDDSDGWYDHVVPPIVSTSQTSFDSFSGPGQCGTTAPGAIQGRCGYGPRLPLLVISPFARENYVDNTLTDQSSILRFIEDNWRLGRIGGGSFDERAGSLNSMFDFKHPRDLRLFLDPTTGQRRNHENGD
ncbi:MAG: alkaline phosphatase family protein [Terriglobales bacterium]|jgi:phospholipase C